MLITTPHLNGKWILELLARVGVISREEISDHKRYYTGKSLERAIAGAGFTQIKVGSFGILWLNLFGHSRT
jgi:hypothetical protein